MSELVIVIAGAYLHYQWSAIPYEEAMAPTFANILHAALGTLGLGLVFFALIRVLLWGAS